MKLLIFLFLIQATQGILHIGCTFGNSTFGNLGTRYRCQVTSITRRANTNHVITYAGNHNAGRTDEDVEGIFITSGTATNACPAFNLTGMPVGFSTLFPNLIALDFRACAFNTLNGDELQEYSKLEYFRNSPGSLNEVPGNLFASNPNLHQIMFDGNPITRVGGNLMTNLQNLTHASFLGTHCINMAVTTAAQIPTLITALGLACPEHASTTTISPNFPEKCFNGFIEVFICEINFNAEEIDRKLVILDNRVSVLEGFGVEVEVCSEKNEILERKVNELTNKIEEMERDFKILMAKLG